MEPRGELRSDLRIAKLAWDVASFALGEKAKRIKIDDFRLRFRDPFADESEPDLDEIEQSEALLDQLLAKTKRDRGGRET